MNPNEWAALRPIYAADLQNNRYKKVVKKKDTEWRVEGRRLGKKRVIDPTSTTRLVVKEREREEASTALEHPPNPSFFAYNVGVTVATASPFAAAWVVFLYIVYTNAVRWSVRSRSIGAHALTARYREKWLAALFIIWLWLFASSNVLQKRRRWRQQVTFYYSLNSFPFHHHHNHHEATV